MKYKQLRRLVAEGEGLNIEFKRKVYYPQKILKEIVAFTNTEGGYLFIGVSDDGQIPGLKYPEEAKEMMIKTIEDYCSPAIEYSIHSVSVPYTPQHEVIVFEIPPSPQRPIYLIYNKKRGTGKAYVRIADKSVQASKEMRLVMRARARQDDTLLQYGDKERFLLQYLGNHSRINVEKYAELADITEKQASEILVKMTVAKVINIEPQEGGYDYFVQGNSFAV